MRRLLAGITLVLAASIARAQCAPRGDLGDVAQAGRSLTATFDVAAGSCVVDGTFLDSYTFTGNAGDNVELSISLDGSQTWTPGVAVGFDAFSQPFASQVRANPDLTVTLPSTGTYVVFVGMVQALPTGTYTLNARAPGVTVGCTTDSKTLCLNASRFRVTTSFTANGSTGQGNAVSLTGDTGYFWFFSSGNVEMVIKVVDGRPVNGKFWAFAGGLTNVDTTITVTDTTTGTVRTYHNPANTAFQPIQDTSAF